MRLKKRFKKVACCALAVIFLFAAQIIAASCRHGGDGKKGSNLVKSDQTADVDYNRWSALGARCGSTLYFLNRIGGAAQYILYADTETQLSGYLCGKPECTHSDENCNAWIGNASNLFIYDDHIYWVSMDYNDDVKLWLNRMELNGEKHKQVMQLTFSLDDLEELYPTRNTTVQMHQGILYVSGEDQRVSDGEMFGYSQITAYDVASGKYERVYLGENHPDTAGYGFKVQCNGDDIWYLEYYNGYSESDAASAVTPFLHVYRYNITQKSTEIIYDGAYPDALSTIMDIYVNSDGLWFTSYTTQADGHTQLWQLEGKSKTPVLKYTIESNTGAWITDGLIAVYSLPDDAHIRTAFIDFEGNLISDQIYPRGEMNIKFCMVAGFDREKLCMLYDDLESKTAFVLFPTDGSNMQILWQE